MAYTINKTDGTVLVQLEDGVLDTTTNLDLIGKSYSEILPTQLLTHPTVLSPGKYFMTPH